MSYFHDFDRVCTGGTPTHETAGSFWGAPSMERTMSDYTENSIGSDYISSAPDLDQMPAVDGGFYTDIAPMNSTYSMPQDPNYILDGKNPVYTDAAAYTDASAPRSLYSAAPALPMLQQFDEAVGHVADVAKRATYDAWGQLSNGVPMTLSFLTFDAMQAAEETVGQEPEYASLDSSQVFRKTVQRALFESIWTNLTSGELNGSYLSQILELAVLEAAYQLMDQLRKERTRSGSDICDDICYGICQVAIAATLEDIRDRIADMENREASDAARVTGHSLGPVSSHGARFACTQSGCKQKPFGRQADLERHIKSVHVEDALKTQFKCDYKKCVRHEQPFYRRDHFRDHLREFHKEDLLRRGVKNDDATWWSQRAFKPILEGWWRCSRCLVTRVQINKYGHVCPTCNHNCEPARVKLRKQYQKRQ